MRLRFSFLLITTLLAACGCISVNLSPFGGKTESLKEYTLQGKGREKILLIHVTGFISDSPKKKMVIFQEPSIVEEIVAQLRKAEKDKNIKSIIFQIDSPGGTTSASDVLYHEIVRFKERTGVKVVAALMDVAASGGYYVSLPADMIIAHPTTVTGSVGVIFLRPKVVGLMDKVGIGVEINKSGTFKDMGSPFRQATPEEEKLFKGIIDQLAKRFIELVVQHREIDEQSLSRVSTGRVFLAEEAQNIGLVDKIGYLSDAISEAASMGGLKENPKVVVYRRTEYPNDNVYNLSSSSEGVGPGLAGLDVLRQGAALQPNFFYLWLPTIGSE